MKLHIPDKITPAKDEIINQPVKFKQWLTGLSQSNMGDITRNIFNALCEHNKHIMPDADRFENLEVLRQPLREIFNNLQKYFTNRTLPLPEKSQKIINLNQSLLREMAIGYKIIIDNASSSDNTNIEMISTAICRAIRYQSELLLRASEVYAQSPAGTWLDLHTMYDYADKKGFAHHNIKDEESTTGSVSIEDYYKQILLFALARPIALRQRDTELVYQKLSEWAKLTKLSNTADEQDIKRIFCVRVTQDRQPSYLKQEDCNNDDPIRTLHASALSDAIQNNLDAIAANTTERISGNHLSPETLQVLASSWGIFAKRRFVRSTRIGHIAAAIGISSAAKAIKNEDSIKKASDPLYEQHTQTEREQLNASLALLAEQEDAEPNKNNQDSKAASSTPNTVFNDPTKMAFNGDLQINQEDVDSHWEIVNVSAGGYCLRWNSDETSKAQIGELIALREREANGSFQWRVGAIRWMQFTREHGLEIGVQLLSPNISTATIRQNSKPDTSSLNCIMLPGINPLKIPATLLLTTQSFKINDCLNLNVLGQSMEIKLNHIKEKTGSFTQFAFTKTEATITMYNTGRKIEQDNADDFSEIWSSL